MTRVVVVGAGSIGWALVLALSAAGDDVTVVDVDPAAAASLAPSGITAVAGDATEAEVLEEAGALRADIVVACTGQDEVNLLVAYVAKRHLQVPRVAARLNHAASRWLFGASWGVDAVLSPADGLVPLVHGVPPDQP